MKNNKAYRMISLVLASLLVFSMIPYLGSSVYAATTIIPNGDYSISVDGEEYQLENGYSGTITIANNVNTVTITGDTDNITNTDTRIVVAVGRTVALELTVKDLHIIAPADNHGIDFGSAGNYDHKLNISGTCKITGDANQPNSNDSTYGAGIHVPSGVQLTINKVLGLTDNEAQLEATGGYLGAGIGGGYGGAGGDITISGGTLTATGGYLGAGIGGGYDGVGENITISGGIVSATGGYGGAGIGGGYDGVGENITISGGTVSASGGALGAGIGGGNSGAGENITISGDTVSVTGGYSGAGIGGGAYGSGENITISGGTVSATGGALGAGIGGGNEGAGGTIIIDNNPTVIATGSTATDIGNGYNTLGMTTLKDSSGNNMNYIRTEIIDIKTSNMIPTATVIIDSAQHKTNSNGITTYFVRGNYYYQISAKGYATSTGLESIIVAQSMRKIYTLFDIPPELNTATVDKNILILTYDEDLDTPLVPKATDFEVRTSGGINITVAAVTISDNTVTLTLDNDVKHTDTVTISFAIGTNPIQDLAGNIAVAFTDKPVLNYTLNPSSGGGSSSGSTTPRYKGILADKIEIPVNIDVEGKKATINLNLDKLNKSFEESKGETVQVKLPSIDGISSYKTELPKNYFNPEKERKIEVVTDIGMITIPSNILDNQNIKKDSTIGIDIKKTDTKTLPDKTKDKIGDRPIIELSLTVDGEQQNWENKESPITVSIPYIPSEEELLNPEYIVIWYIDRNGNAIEVPSGRYNKETGMVEFETTHFSYYAINYVEKTFEDIANYSWAKHQIEVLASKGIINGISETKYEPQVNITRADFLTLLVRTLELNSDFENNFEDVKTTDYYYAPVGIAKVLGITKGDTNNNFNPKTYITRQDMMVFTFRALVLKNILNNEIDLSILEQYNDIEDATKYSLYAIVAILADNELIKGYNGQINLLGNTTRAEVAALLYRIYNLN